VSFSGVHPWHSSGTYCILASRGGASAPKLGGQIEKKKFGQNFNNFFFFWGEPWGLAKPQGGSAPACRPLALAIERQTNSVMYFLAALWRLPNSLPIIRHTLR
jgi:hypothetical protein